MNAVVQPTPTEAVPPQTASTQSERRERQRTRRQRDAMWRPSHSTPCQELELSLNSDQAQRLFSMALVSAQRTLYYIYHTLPDGGAVDAVGEVEKIIEGRFSKLETELDDEIKRMTTMAESIGSDPLSTYTDAQTFTVVLYTPEATRFANLLRQLDTLASIVDGLWFSGVIKRQQRSQIIMRHRNSIGRFSREMFVLLNRARGSVRRAQQARDKARTDKEQTPAAASSDTVDDQGSTDVVDHETEVTEESAVSEAPVKPAAKPKKAAAKTKVTEEAEA